MIIKLNLKKLKFNINNHKSSLFIPLSIMPSKDEIYQFIIAYQWWIVPILMVFLLYKIYKSRDPFTKIIIEDFPSIGSRENALNYFNKVYWFIFALCFFILIIDIIFDLNCYLPLFENNDGKSVNFLTPIKWLLALMLKLILTYINYRTHGLNSWKFIFSAFSLLIFIGLLIIFSSPTLTAWYNDLVKASAVVCLGFIAYGAHYFFLILPINEVGDIFKDDFKKSLEDYVNKMDNGSKRKRSMNDNGENNISPSPKRQRINESNSKATAQESNQVNDQGNNPREIYHPEYGPGKEAPDRNSMTERQWAVDYFYRVNQLGLQSRFDYHQAQQRVILKRLENVSEMLNINPPERVNNNQQVAVNNPQRINNNQQVAVNQRVAVNNPQRINSNQRVAVNNPQRINSNQRVTVNNSQGINNNQQVTVNNSQRINNNQQVISNNPGVPYSNEGNISNKSHVDFGPFSKKNTIRDLDKILSHNEAALWYLNASNPKYSYVVPKDGIIPSEYFSQRTEKVRNERHAVWYKNLKEDSIWRPENIVKEYDKWITLPKEALLAKEAVFRKNIELFDSVLSGKASYAADMDYDPRKIKAMFEYNCKRIQDIIGNQ
jgi:hypothetical protein